jgi:hypothetical protein
LDRARGSRAQVLAAACKTLVQKGAARELTLAVEGVVDTPAVVLLSAPAKPSEIRLGGEPLSTFDYSAKERLVWIRFTNQAAPRQLTIRF